MTEQPDAEPVTLDDCRADYEAGAADRAELDEHARLEQARREHQ